MGISTGELLEIEIVPLECRYREPFVISRETFEVDRFFELQLRDRDGFIGRAEASGIRYAKETVGSMRAQIEAVAPRLRGNIEREQIQRLLPHGGARNALDVALWDLEAKRTGIDPFTRAGTTPAPVASARTIGIRTLDEYAAAARTFAGFDCLKVKVDAREPIAAVEAVRADAPGVRLIVDPNQAWSLDLLKEVAPEMARFGVDLIEQPIAIGQEEGLEGWRCPVPLAADELIHDVDDLAKAVGRFQVINIKLDKAGGLTAALELADAAEALGFALMVGCMGGTSLAMAPGMVVAQRCRFVDLDAPLLLTHDRADGFIYVDGRVAEPYRPALWG